MADRSREHLPRAWRNTPRYLRLKAQVLAEQPLCAHCAERGLVAASAELDHIQPVEMGGDKWARGNLQGLCVPCHRRKSDGELRRMRWPNAVVCVHGTTSVYDCPDCLREAGVPVTG